MPVLPRIANFDDLDPLCAEPGIELIMVPPGRPLPRDAALVILPGSKATIGDLAAVRREGWDIDLLAHRRHGGRILGLCGGYQMLGRTIADPLGIEGERQTASGLGLLDIDTVLGGDKRLVAADGIDLASQMPVNGYEMHLGTTTGPGLARPMLRLGAGVDGCVSVDGRVAGCYLHGLFAGDAFRRAFLAGLGAPPGNIAYQDQVEFDTRSAGRPPRTAPRSAGPAGRGAPAAPQMGRVRCPASQKPSTRPPRSRQASE